MRNVIPDTTWHVIYTKPRFEKKVFELLQQHKIEAFLPLQRTIRQWKDRKKLVELPLFPSYLFVHISSVNKWEVLSINGVVRFLQFEGRDATLPESDIEAIRKSLVANPEVSDNQEFKYGDEVVITSGPLVGLEGVLVESNGKKRLAIQINAIEKLLLVNVIPGSVAKLQEMRVV